MIHEFITFWLVFLMLGSIQRDILEGWEFNGIREI